MGSDSKGPAVAMQCGSCAEEIPSDSLFCPECGARQTPGASTGMGLNSASAPTPNPVAPPTDLPPVEPVQQAEPVAVEQAENSVATVQEVLGDMMGDAPACPDCGHITIRNGSCYKCLNCGNSLGCS